MLRRDILLPAVIAGLLCIASCARDNSLRVMPEYVTSINASLEQPEPESGATRADFTLNGSGGLVFSWSSIGDVLGIYPVGGDQVAFPLSGVSGDKASFNGGSWSLKTSYKYAAYFPFSADNYTVSERRIPISLTGQRQTGNNSPVHLGKFSFMVAEASQPDATGNVSLQFKQSGCFARFRIQLPSGVVPVKAVLSLNNDGRFITQGTLDLTETFTESSPTITPTAYSKSVTLECSDIKSDGTDILLYMMMAPQNLTGYTLTMTVTDTDGKIYTFTAAGKNMLRNQACAYKFTSTGQLDANYLCLTAGEPGSVGLRLQGDMDVKPSLQYSTDGQNWLMYNVGYTPDIVLESAGDKVYFKGNSGFLSNADDSYYYFVLGGKTAASGSVTSLLGDAARDMLVEGYDFYGLFRDCVNLTKAPELPSTKLSQHCYERMFSGCTSLTEMPELPATVLALNCYSFMFEDCTGLTEVHALPAVTLEEYCYFNMFNGCTSLVKGPDINAGALDYRSCYGMFDGCTSLRELKVSFKDWAQAKDATSYWMYDVNTAGNFYCPDELALINGSNNIPNGWLTPQGVNLDNCLCFTAQQANSTVGLRLVGTGWHDVPTFEYSTDGINWADFEPGTTPDVTLAHIGDKVYFRGYNAKLHLDYQSYDRYKQFVMTGKVAASGSVMSLVDRLGTSDRIAHYYEFASLFKDCTSLTEAPNLPATTLDNYCYYEMFSGCTGLTEAPELPAQTLVAGCYEKMFAGCSNLNSVTVNFTEWMHNGGSTTTSWLDGVAATGVINCPIGLDISVYDASHIPAGWTVNLFTPIGVLDDYLCFTAQQANSSVAMAINGADWTLPKIYYSTDGVVWNKFVPGTTTVTLSNIGDKVYFVGNNTSFSKSDTQYVQFSMEGKVAASGKIMSLLDPSLSSNTVPSYAFYMLFADCSSLTAAPELPAKNLALFCYSGMFLRCTSLTTAPELPATNLGDDCYSLMFMMCTSLTNAPELPALNLAYGCYYGMFLSCTSLTTAPELPATNLEGCCYYYMFGYCTSLNSIKVYFTDWGTSTNQSTEGWLTNTSSTGTFYCKSTLDTSILDKSHIPSGWTISTF